MITCPSCGSQNNDGTTFCSTCGAPLAAAPQQPQQPYGQPQQPYGQPQQPYGQPQQPYGQPVPVGVEQKSKMVAGLLGIFLGSFGAGRFYLGYTKLGVLQLVVSFVTCGAGSIWGLIDGIMILTGSVKVDANNIPLKD